MTAIDPHTQLGIVTLSVTDLARSLAFYQQNLLSRRRRLPSPSRPEYLAQRWEKDRS